MDLDRQASAVYDTPKIWGAVSSNTTGARGGGAGAWAVALQGLHQDVGEGEEVESRRPRQVNKVRKKDNRAWSLMLHYCLCKTKSLHISQVEKGRKERTKN